MTILGNLKTTDARTMWTNEARDFTPWLANNIEVLNKSLGLELEVESTEVAAGPYSADILAKDTATGQYVIIENQLEKTDHDHLGKAITYASVLNASSVIWIATGFTDEHKQALDWLNEHSVDSIDFYGVVLELWQIDDSKPALKLNVVSRPNYAMRRAAQAKNVDDLSPAKQTQLKFWNRFYDALVGQPGIPSSLQTPAALYWYNVALGKSNVQLSNICNTNEGKIGVRVYIHNKVADKMLPFLEERKDIIESQIGETLEWNPSPDNQDKVIVLFKHNVDLNDESSWDEPIQWLVEKTVAFRRVLAPILREFRG